MFVTRTNCALTFIKIIFLEYFLNTNTEVFNITKSNKYTKKRVLLSLSIQWLFLSKVGVSYPLAVFNLSPSSVVSFKASIDGCSVGTTD